MWCSHLTNCLIPVLVHYRIVESVKAQKYSNLNVIARNSFFHCFICFWSEGHITVVVVVVEVVVVSSSANISNGGFTVNSHCCCCWDFGKIRNNII